MSMIWLLAVSLPLLIAGVLLTRPPLRAGALRLAPGAALPALVLALGASPAHGVELPWLLLGARLGLDAIGQVFLFSAALVWTLAGYYARAYLADDPARHRFFFFYLATMSGNLGLIVAQDVATFYMFFALMTFAAYGLVIHSGSRFALRAGRVYIGMAIFGEMLLLAGFLLAVQAAAGLDFRGMAAAVAAAPHRNLIIALCLAGFGVKAGVLPLHVWLPLAHPVAPTPASAVLSGCLIKAGLLGWLRVLPLGEAAFPEWGALCMVMGLGAAFFGVAIGLAQDDPKVNLAYSSISQMGFMTVGLGIGLASPADWPLVLAAILVYALHHALAKAALFLGIGVVAASSSTGRQRLLVIGGLAFAALGLAGAPLTSGAVAKTFLKGGAALAPHPWSPVLGWLLPLAALGTALLMGRFLFLATRPSRAAAAGRPSMGLWFPWVTLLVAVATAAWVIPAYYLLDGDGSRSLSPANLWVSAWPLLLGLLLVWGVCYRKTTIRPARFAIAAGDLLVLGEWGIRGWQRCWCTRLLPLLLKTQVQFSATRDNLLTNLAGRTVLGDLERQLARWETAGLLMAILMTTMFAILALTWAAEAGVSHLRVGR